ncbi:hypothetical protein [Ruegeria arenilitoris]|uniref:hypothetical protein n=2 Tax=Ruegeria arenilitoris TaxID=1173585 RepID=UPI001479E9C3|nr:hypothetical protein [Ruegeria arenilitoris]
MFVPAPDAFAEILKMDTTKWFSPGKRIEGKGGNAADKRYISRTQKVLRDKFQAGQLTAALSEKHIGKFVKRFGDRSAPLVEFRDRIKSSSDWRDIAITSGQLANGEIAGGLPKTRSNLKALIEFRKLEYISWVLRKKLYYDQETKWDLKIAAPSRILNSRTYQAFRSPAAFEVWKSFPFPVLHPCEFLTLGYVLQQVTQQRRMLSDVSIQENPSQVKTIFVENYLLKNSQWPDKSTMWEATPIDRIKTFTERNGSPFIDTFVQYIELVDHSENPKLASVSPEHRNATNSYIRSCLFLISVFCCFAIRMRQDWKYWEQTALRAGFEYADLIHDFQDFERGVQPNSCTPSEKTQLVML